MPPPQLPYALNDLDEVTREAMAENWRAGERAKLREDRKAFEQRMTALGAVNERLKQMGPLPGFPKIPAGPDSTIFNPAYHRQDVIPPSDTHDDPERNYYPLQAYPDSTPEELNSTPASGIEGLGGPERDGRIKANIETTAQDNPDAEAELGRISKLSGHPIDALRALGGDATKALRSWLDIDHNTQAAPTLRKKYTSQDFARLAADDSKALAEIEKASKGVYIHPLQRVIPDLIGAAQRAPTVAYNLPGALASSAGAFGEQVTGLVRGASEFVDDFFRAPPSVVIPALMGASDEELKRIAETPAPAQNPEDFLPRVAAWMEGARKASKGFKEATMPVGESDVESGIYSGIQSFGTMLPWLAAAAVTGQPEVATLGMAGGTAGEAYGRAGDVNPNLSVIDKTMFALREGGVEWVTEVAPMSVLFNDIANKAGFGKLVLDNLTLEMPGEQVATLLQDANDWLTLHPEKSVKDFLEERPSAALQTAIATAVTTVVQTGAVQTIDTVKSKVEALKAKADREKTISEGGLDGLDAIVKAARASKLRERSPEEIEAFVNELAADSPLKAGSISPEAFAQVAQAAGVSPQELAAQLGVADQNATALGAGADIVIPVGTIAAKIAGQDYEQVFMQNVKTSPLSLSREELKALPEAQRERLAAQAERIAQEVQGDTDFAAGVESVRADIEQQLETVGRFVGEPNRLWAKITAIGYGTLAKDLGVPVEQVYADNPLSIVGERMTEGSALAQRAANPITNEERATMRAALDPREFEAWEIAREGLDNTQIAARMDVNSGDVASFLVEAKKKGAVFEADKPGSKPGQTAAKRQRAFDYFAANPENAGKPIGETAATLGLTAQAADRYRSMWKALRRRLKAAEKQLVKAQEKLAAGRANLPAQPAAQSYGPSEEAIAQRALRRAEAQLEAAKAQLESGLENLPPEPAAQDYGKPNTLAQPLDMSDEARLERAKAMGADVSKWEALVKIYEDTLVANEAEYDAAYAAANDERDTADMELDERLEAERDATVAAATEKAEDKHAAAIAKAEAERDKATAELGEEPDPEDEAVWDAYSEKESAIEEAYNDAESEADSERDEAIEEAETKADAKKDKAYEKQQAAIYEAAEKKQEKAEQVQEAKNDKAYEAFQDALNELEIVTPDGQKRSAYDDSFTATLEQPRRGEYAPSKHQLALLKGADLSTFLHEMGHHFLEVYVNVSTGLRLKQAELQDKGEDLTAGEKRVLQDTNDLLAELFKAKGAPQTGSTEGVMGQPANILILEFLDSYLPNADEASVKALYQKLFLEFDQALRERSPNAKIPEIFLWRTSSGRVIAFNGAEYNHAQARLLLQAMDHPDANLRMEHARWDKSASWKFQRWHDTSGTNADDGSKPSLAQGAPSRQAFTIDDETLARAANELTDVQFEVFKAAALGGTNTEVADRVNEGRAADKVLTGKNVSVVLHHIREKGFDVEILKRSPALGLAPKTLRIVHALSLDQRPADVAKDMDVTLNLVNQVKFQRKKLIAEYKARRGGFSFGQGAIFYSALKRAAERAKQTKAPGADWKAILRKAEGVKIEEIEAVGLFDYIDMLTEQGQKQIDRDDIVAFLDSNGIQIEEILLGPPVQQAVAAPEAMTDTAAAGDLADYNQLLEDYKEEINDELNEALDQVFEEEIEVFVESNRTAERIVSRAAESIQDSIEDSYQDDFYSNGVYELQFYVKKEEDESHEGEGDPPMVWVVRSQYDSRSRQDTYGAYATEDQAQEAAGEMDSESEQKAFISWIDDKSSEIYEEAQKQALDDIDVRTEVKELWFNSLDPAVLAEMRLDAAGTVLSRRGEEDLFRQMNPERVIDAPRDSRPPYPSTKWDRFTLVKGSEYRELLLILASHKGDPFVHSVHWPGKRNVFGHVRFSIVDGVVVIEEAQHDWHQKGRDDGYKQPTPEIVRSVTAEELQVVSRELDWLVTAPDGRSFNLGRGTENHQSGVREYGVRFFNDQAARINREADIENAKRVPDAPMKDATSWGALILKRMIRWAAENGYSEIAWTPGDVQAERWNMFNVVDKLVLLPQAGKGTWYLEGYKDGKQVFSKGDMSDKDLTEHVGKEAVAKLMAAPEEKFDVYDKAKVLNLSDDTMVGPGKGMRFFYDTALVNEANRLLKKHGGKVDTRVFPHEGKSRKEGAGGATEVEIDKGGNKWMVPATAYHHMVIPDSLKAAALEGLPLFQTQNDTQKGPQGPLPEGATPLDVWNQLSFAEKEPYHEEFARLAEAYFMEGKAPVPALRKMFEKFRQWLTTVYHSIANLNVDLTPEVRSILDRMFASQQDIAEANREHNLAPLFTVKPAHMTDDEWEDYQTTNANAVTEAEATLSQRSLRDVKWLSNARSKAVRRLQGEAREQRKAIRAEVTQEVMAEPVNVARQFLSRGVNEAGEQVGDNLAAVLPNGEVVHGAAKLNIDAMTAMYPPESKVNWQSLGYGKYGLLANNGLHPDAIAPLLGYPSGEALVRDLLSAEKSQEKINGITDQRMLERYGDLADDDAISQAADEAVHSQLRARVLAGEYAAITNAMGERKLLLDAAQEAARTLVLRMPAMKLNAQKFNAAERRAGRAAEEAMRRNDLAGAAAAKKDQILNFFLAKEVYARQKERDRALGMFRRILLARRDSISKSRNFDLVQAARAVLASHGMAQMRNAPVSYLAAVKAYDPVLYASLEPTIIKALTSNKKLADLTVDQFLGLRDVVDQLWSLAREEKLVEIGGKKIELKAVTAELGQRLEDLGADGAGVVTEAPTEWQKKMRLFEGMAAGVRRVESWARLMDGGGVGPFTRFIWRPISQAADRYRADNTRYLTKFRDLFRPIEASLNTAKIAAPELGPGGYTFTGKGELLHAILHTGNDSNFRKLLLGRQWGKELADGSLDHHAWDRFVARMVHEGTITQADYAFAQSIWDLLEETKPAAQAAHHRVFGRYFSEITAKPVQTPFGEFRGGYVPAVYDNFLVPDATLRSQQDAIESNDSSMFPAPSHGFTESRVEYNQHLALDLRLLPQHINKVLKFSHMAAPVRDVLRILRSEGFKRLLADQHPTAQSDLLLPWLMRSAQQTVHAPMKGSGGRAVDNFAKGLRRRSGMGLMFANVINTLQQPTGLPLAALMVKKRFLAAGLVRYLSNPKLIHDAMVAASPLMSERASSQAASMSGDIDAIIEAKGPMGKATNWFNRHTYFAQTAVQNVLDVMVWQGAYDQAVSKGETQDEAAARADAVVRQTQGTPNPEDVSRVETGNSLLRLFTAMYTYFNMWGNLLSTEFRQAVREQGLKKKAGRLVYVYMAGFLVPALLAQLIADGLRGQLPDDDDDDGYLDDWLLWFFGMQGRTAVAFVPVVGTTGMAVVNAFNDKPYDDRVLSSPAIGALESVVRAPKDIYDIMTGEGDLSRTAKDTLSLMTLLTGLPFQALSRPVGYALDVAEGDVSPVDAADYMRGLISGTAGKGY